MTQLKPSTLPRWASYLDLEIDEVPLLRIKGTRINPHGPFNPTNMKPEICAGYTDVRITVGYDGCIARHGGGYDVIESDWEIVSIDMIGGPEMDWIEVDRDQPLYTVLKAAIEASSTTYIEEQVEARINGGDQ